MYDRRKKRALQLALMTSEDLVTGGSESGFDKRSHPVWDGDIVDVCGSAIEQVLSRHFRAQRRTFPYAAIERLLTEFVQHEPGYGHGEGLSDRGLARFLQNVAPLLVGWTEAGRGVVEAPIASALRAAAVDAFKTEFGMWCRWLDLDVEPTPDMIARVSSWAERRAAEEVPIIEEVTRTRVADILAEGLREGVSIAQIMRTLREYLSRKLLTAGRAETVAWADARHAANHGVLEAHRALGATEKEWASLRDPFVCSECWENDEEGPIPLDVPFQSGHQHPPAHLRCRCVLTDFGVTRESALEALGLMP